MIVRAFALYLILQPFAAIAQQQNALIIVEKSRRTLAYFEDGKQIFQFTKIKLGDRPRGHKQQQGDERTPEGRYVISGRNPKSRYHLSLRISYPNLQDRAIANRLNVDPGGDIFIHGQPNYSPFARLPNDWTDGCIAVSNREMDLLWSRVKVGTPVQILP